GGDPLLGTNLGEARVKGDVAAAVGGDILEADESLPFAVTGGINRVVSEKLDPVGCVSDAVEGAGDRRHPAAIGHRFDYREILQVVGAAIGISNIVQRDAVESQVYSQAAPCRRSLTGVRED